MKVKQLVFGLGIGLGLSVASAATVQYDMSGSGGWNDGTRWVGGQVPAAGDTVEIPSGTAYAAESDKAKINSVKVNLVNADSVLSITKTSVWNPMFKSGYLMGCGRLEINGTPNEALFDYNYSAFTGDIVLNSGKITAIYDQHALGRSTALSGTTSIDNPPPGKVYIRAGASLDVTGYGNGTTFTLGFKEIHIAGKYTGAQSAVYYPAGAIGLENWNGGTYPNAFRNIVLDGDAWISGHNGANFGIAGSSATNLGRLDLHGHDLSLGCNSGREWKILLKNVVVTNSVPTSGGHIYVDSAGGGTTHTLQIGTGVVFDPNVKIVAGTTGKVALDNAGVPIRVDAELIVDKSGNPLSLLSAVTSGVNEVTLAGKVTVNEGKSLSLADSNPGTHFLLSGGLAGAGDVTVKAQTMYGLTGDSSEFTGKLFLDDNYNWTGLRLGAPASAPANITVAGSTLVVPFPAWTFSQYLAFANAVTYEDSGVYLPSVTIDPSGCPDRTYEMSLKDGDLTNPKAVLGIGGEGTVEVKSLPETGASRFAAWAGTLKFAMNEPIALGTMLATSFRDAAEPGKIVFDGIPEIDIAQNCFWIGTPYLVEANAKGEVTVRNSMLHNAGTTPLADQEGFYVGNAGFGKLVFEDSVVTSRVHVGTEANGVGEFLVKGGSFHHTSGGNSGAAKNMMIAGYRGHGYIELDKTSAEVTGYVAVGYEGSGVMVQKGGTCNLRMSPTDVNTPTQLHVGKQMGGTARRAVGQFRLTDGGKFSCTHDTWLAAIGNSGSYDHYTYGTLTIDGVGSYYSCGPFGIGEAVQSTGILNLNDGGTLYAKTFRGSSAGRAGKSYVNFNGGIYDHRGWGETYLFGLSPDAAKEGDRSVTKVTVYGKGATIISSASQKDRKFGQPIHNATGKGVGSIPWTDTTRVFCGAPAVIVEGDGTGASAMAEYDPVTGTVTNILVTSPGCDYETATAYLVQGPVTNAIIDLTSSLVENDKNGPVEFRHTNNGSFTFDVANDYVGETILSSAFADGAFNITNKDAFAKSSAIKVKSGTLYLGTWTLGDLTAPFKFMGGTIKGDAASYVIPEGKMVVDLKVIVAGETYDMTKNTNLTLPSSVALWNAEGLDESVKYPLLTLPKNYAGVLPTFTGVPTNWHVSRTATGFRLSRDRGSVLILR